MKEIAAHDMLETVICSDGGWLLIGATRAGRGLYCELKKRNMEKLISIWTDKKYNFYRMCGLPMDDPDKVDNQHFKGIILSSDFVEKYYNSISDKYTLNRIPVYEMFGGVDDMDDFQWTDPKYTDIPVNSKELISVNPKVLINEKRLDIVIRYMVCKEIMGHNTSNEIDMFDMYKKLTLSMNNGEEFVYPFTTCSYFSDYKEKKGTANFIDDLTSLIKSMQKNGFSEKHFIPLSSSCGVINGTHRIAVALALEINVYAKIFIGFGEPFLTFDKNDLKRIGCSDKQIVAVEQEYINLKEESIS